MENRFYSFSREEQHLQSVLLYISKSRYGSDWNSTEHSHYFTEFFFITSGRGSFIIEGSEISVEENDFIIVNPQVNHTEKFTGDTSFEYICIGMENIYFRRTSGGAEDYMLYHYKKEKEFCETILTLLLEEAEKEKAYRDCVCKSLCELFIVNIIRRAGAELIDEPTRRVSRASRIAKQYIDENFRNAITLDELAEAAKVNKYHLSHLFSQDYGISPINYLIEKRIEECRILLTTTNHSISQIAVFTGFSSPSYFSQCFKRATGMQPDTYRKKFKDSLETS